MQVVDTKKYRYERIKVRGPDGVARYTAGNKDAVAKSLFGMTRERMKEVAKENNIEMDDQFKLRNLGHLRMILGQALRHRIIKAQAKVIIRGQVIASLDQKVQWPSGYVEEEKGTPAKPIRKSRTAA